MITDPEESDERPGIRGYLDVLRRRWLIVTFTVVVVAGASLGSSLLETPRYRASSDLVVDSSNPTTSLGLVDATLTTQELATQVQILTSESVADRAAEALGLGLSGRQLLGRVSAGAVGDTRVLRIAAVDIDPQRAADIANAFADAFITHRREEALERVVAAGTTLRARLDTLELQRVEVEADLAATDPQDPDYRGLVREQDTIENQIAQMSAQLNILEGSDLLIQDSGAVIRQASAPGSPEFPDPVEDGIMGVFVGLLLGIGLAFARDYMDDGVRSDTQARVATGDRPVLGFVPVLENATKDGVLELLRDPASPGSEAIRTLRTNLRFASRKGPLRTVLVSSPLSGDGKSTIAANLAIAVAQSGSRVILIDADLRRPSLHTRFGVTNGVGLSTVLTGQHELGETLMSVGVNGLRLVPAGVTPPNPAELLAGAQPVLTEAARVADMVIIDGPPLLAVADSLELAAIVDGVVMALAYGETRQRAIRESARRLRRVGGSLLGSVLNLAPGEVGYYYGYRVDVDVEEPAATAATGFTSRGPNGS